MASKFLTSLLGLAVVLLGFFAQDAFGIQCFICDSEQNKDCKENVGVLKDEDCSDWCRKNGGYIKEGTAIPGGNPNSPPRKYPKTDCPSVFVSCRKIKQSTTTAGYNNGTAEDRVIRTCGYQGLEANKTYEYRNSETTKSEIFSCYNDKCNSADGMHVSMILTISTLAIVGLHRLF